MDKSPAPNRNCIEVPNLCTPKSITKDDHQRFSPITVKSSPVSKSPQVFNLTGNPRKVRDNVAELYNLIQEWNSQHITSSALVSEICTLKLPSLSAPADSGHNLYPAELIPLIDKLDGICQKMNEIVERMKNVSKELQGISKLENFRKVESSAMFLTWPSERFYETAELIYQSYSKELKLKIYIKENLAHSCSKPNLIFQSAAWVHQPYIQESVNIRLEAMLKETGHR